ncbi:MAG TPA: hypothetical protein VHG28_14575 [Longimicrobiaceae bacterium]|nr:hypothetical protein [Longimicrobiaceae bacterium]
MRIIIEIDERGATAPARVSVTDEVSQGAGVPAVASTVAGVLGAQNAGPAPLSVLQAVPGAPVIPIPAPGGSAPPAGSTDLSAGAAPGAASQAPAVSVENYP